MQIRPYKYGWGGGSGRGRRMGLQSWKSVLGRREEDILGLEKEGGPPGFCCHRSRLFSYPLLPLPPAALSGCPSLSLRLLWTTMAPSFRSKKTRSSRDEEDFSQARGDRKARKPLVEKKRRARINESLQELRLILSETEFQTKMENAEVLELTVKRVQGILQSRSLDGDKMQREASERFAAGYIQCMHEVHTFVSNCPGIDSTIAAELLNHLLESMPLNEGSFQDLIVDVLSDPSISQRPSGDEPSQMPGDSHGTLSLSSLTSPLPSPSSSEEICSDLDNTETEQSHISLDGLDRSRNQNVPFPSLSKSLWRPW